ncbi:MAG: 2,3,4,5-tetrahydropyridine-2,6-dicarboxylate N-succinyltransferase [Polyangiaceae bacterium]|nr:2,3,4,5-tetrahydropyridine-2,6-dicarboxylate N-succinyltransferase [Polyangiaceae bacterium]
MTESTYRPLIEQAFENRELLKKSEHKAAVEWAIGALDQGEIRVASQVSPGEWTTHAWVKQAVLLYFGVTTMEELSAGPMNFYDKLPIKKNLKEAGVRVVPPGTVRYGAHMEPGTVLMPGYVNIGAYVAEGTMVDTWATVGSCAQIGKNCHLSGGVGIGGVLEPPSAQPVIIEDGCFIGSRVIIVEGFMIESEAVIGAGVTLTSSTAVIDVTGPEPKELRGRIPARSVVIPGMRKKKFPAGEFMIPAAFIIGQRKESTDKKTSLNAALRDFNVAV